MCTWQPTAIYSSTRTHVDWDLLPLLCGAAGLVKSQQSAIAVAAFAAAAATAA
jgi:hypothetical protein